MSPRPNPFLELCALNARESWHRRATADFRRAILKAESMRQARLAEHAQVYYEAARTRAHRNRRGDG